MGHETLLACTLLLWYGPLIAQASGGLQTSSGLTQAAVMVEVHEGSICAWCQISPILGETEEFRRVGEKVREGRGKTQWRTRETPYSFSRG